MDDVEGRSYKDQRKTDPGRKIRPSQRPKKEIMYSEIGLEQRSESERARYVGI